MKILITGATGFLGGALSRRYAAQGWDVIGLGRQRAVLAALPQGIRPLAADLSDPQSLQAFGAEHCIDAVVHAAALSSPFGPYSAFEQANVEGTKQALLLAKRLGAKRFVHISSPSVAFSAKDQINLREDAPLPKPINAYARSKAEAEAVVLAERELQCVVLRPRGIYGRGDTALLPRLLKAAQRRPLPLLRGGQAAIDLTHLEDVMRAVDAALTTPVQGEVFNISGGELLPVRQIAESACARAGVSLRWRAVPLWPAMAAARGVEVCASLRQREPLITPYSLALFAFRQSLDLSKAKALLGWEPQVSFEEGLERSFESLSP